MKILLSVLLSLTLTVSSSQTFARSEHLVDFVGLFKLFCINAGGGEAAEDFLERWGHEESEDFEGSYEILLGEIEYGLTPSDGSECTADVLLRHSSMDEMPIIQQEELVNFITQKFTLTLTSSREFSDTALNNASTDIRQYDFKDPNGREYRLLYPESNQGSYYMTLTLVSS